jgi:dephospho-CoA kinase
VTTSNPLPNLPSILPAPLVIGVAGAIGAGKSTVAAHFAADHGCVHIDFDQEAKAALDRPDVRPQLVAAFGPEVLTSAGVVDRHLLARRVFADPDARRRLESITHPLVWRTREQARDEAAAVGAWAVVLDAALLYEVGLDAECDLVIFVDAPRETRLNRVRQHRHWNDDELDRREATQLPAAEKRRRAHVVIQNTRTPAELAERVAELSAMLKGRSGRASRPPESGG